MSDTLTHRWSSERGTAIVMAMYMVLLVSIVGAAMMRFGVNETESTMNYKSMAQARYGAESGLHAAANYLLDTTKYAPPDAGGADPIAAYTISGSSVQVGGADVVLSSNTTLYPANYPDATKRTAFENAVTGWLEMASGMGRGRIQYTARARLIAMFQQPDAYSGGTNTFQTWEITGIGTVQGAGASSVEVTAVIERRPQPAFSYAAFAKDAGCGAMTFSGGGAGTGSYDSTALGGGPPPSPPNAYGGDVGTNGNLELNGNGPQVSGTLSTPMQGVGNCAVGNVTALDGNLSQVTGGLVQLPQAIELPTPEPVASPITTAYVHGCGGFAVGVCTNAGGVVTLGPTAGTPVVQLGNVSLAGSDTLALRGGTYEINSLVMAGNAEIRVVPGTGQVKIKIGGSGFGAGQEVVKIAGNGLSNPSWDPMNFQMIYGGYGDVKFAGNGAVSSVLYAPNAAARMVGNGTIYGSVMANTITDVGNAMIVYDRNLKKTGFTTGNATMSKFTWSSF